MTRIRTQDRTQTSRLITPWRVALILLLFGLILAGMTLYNAGSRLVPVDPALQVNWGIAVPDGLREIEHASEESFHGDGYRFTVFDVVDSTKLEGTFFDVRQMSPDELTSDQIALVIEVTDEHAPENYLLVPQENLLKATRVRYENELLAIYDEATDRFYVYESFL